MMRSQKLKISFDQQIYEIVKESIKEVDRNLFLIADHEKQALNVLKKLDLAGYVVLPRVPSKDMILAGKEAISFGITDPNELISEIYNKIIGYDI